MDLRYPIGPFEWKGESSEEQRRVRIDRIEAAPVRLTAAVQGLSEEQFDTPYRPGGWTLRQVVHHLADSHLNSYTRFRLALTEDAPGHQGLRSGALGGASRREDCAGAGFAGPTGSALHRRWVQLLRSMAPADFARTFVHPELGGVSLDRNLALYAWHGDHHTGHITGLRQRMGWA